MSDDTQTTNNTEQKSELSLEALQAQISEKDETLQDYKRQFEAIKAKNEELLNEAKKAKQKAREEIEAKEQAKLEKAKKDGDYEQLLKSSEKQKEALQKQLEDMQASIRNEKVQSTSYKIASELADGPAAELLSEFVKQKLTSLDSNAQWDDTVLNAVKNEFETNEKYKIFLRGPKSSGGSATGTKADGNSSAKTMTRAQFDSLSNDQRHKAMIVDKYTLTDD